LRVKHEDPSTNQRNDEWRYAAQSYICQCNPHRSTFSPVFKHDLQNVTMDDWEVTVSYVGYAP
jgi:formylglycine-generating enzyme required for sulfatase activity